MENQSNEIKFEVTDRKVTLATRISDYFFAKKVRRNIKQNRTPEMKAYLAERKNPVAVKLVSTSTNEENPAVLSVEQKVKNHLISGKSITTLECLRLFGSSELRHEVASLRKHIEIKDKWITTPTGKRVKSYYIA